MDQSVARSSLHNRERKNEKSLELNSQWFPFLVNIAGGSWIGCTILFSQDGLILASFIFVFFIDLNFVLVHCFAPSQKCIWMLQINMISG